MGDLRLSPKSPHSTELIFGHAGRAKGSPEGLAFRQIRRSMGAGLKTQTSAARVHSSVPAFRKSLAVAVAYGARAVRSFGRGVDVLSKALDNRLEAAPLLDELSDALVA